MCWEFGTINPFGVPGKKSESEKETEVVKADSHESYLITPWTTTNHIVFMASVGFMARRAPHVVHGFLFRKLFYNEEKYGTTSKKLRIKAFFALGLFNSDFNHWIFYFYGNMEGEE